MGAVVAVSTILNEADICKRSLYHLLDQGVDHIYVAHGASTDGTTELLELMVRETGQITVVPDDMEYHAQPHWMNRLMHQAGADGAEWILPVDADEFWYAVEDGTIAYNLRDLPDDVRVLHVQSFQMRDWQHRWLHMGLGKVAFRYEPDAVIANGNHSVALPYPAYSGVLALREIQFRSLEHLIRKCHERVDRIDPSLPYTEGTHQRELAVLSDAELGVRWLEWQNREAVFDPIPTTRAPRN